VADAVADALDVRLDIDRPAPVAVAFTVAPGTVLALVGPSGSGKTTTLRAIAGHVRPRSGRIACAGEVWLDTDAGIALPARRRAAGLVFQSYALFPHMSAIDNVMAAMADLPPTVRRDQARAVLARLNLVGSEDRRPGELSGGQQQRVAVARALARRPRVLLLDEPFSAVDQPTRQRLQSEMLELRRELPMPIVLVTHNLDEVARLADTVVLIAGGETIAAGTADEILNRGDLRRYTGTFEVSTLLHAPIAGHDETAGTTWLDHPAGRISVPYAAGAPGTMRRVRVHARDVALAVGEPGNISIRNRLRATVTGIEEAEGHSIDVRLDVGGDMLIARVTREAVEALDLRIGRPVTALIKATAVDRPEE
jgi:molybdate transport system ATP-binding protein